MISKRTPRATDQRRMDGFQRILCDPDRPIEERLKVIQYLLHLDTDEGRQVLEQVLQKVADTATDDRTADKEAELDAVLAQMKQGPLRVARFAGSLRLPTDTGPARALIRFADGSETFALIVSEELSNSLSTGDAVITDASGAVILDRLHAEAGEAAGELGVFKRRLDTRVEVTIRDQTFMVEASPVLLDKIDEGTARPGHRILVSQEKLALDAIENAAGHEHLQFVDRSPPPRVTLGQDVGNPPTVLEEMLGHIRGELFHPDLRRRYGLKRSLACLFVGPSGCGKTLCVEGLIRAILELCAKRADVPVERLPPRVVRIRLSEVLSKWLGESDSRIALLFDEAVALHDAAFVTPAGESIRLPVIVVAEEIDGLARRRGGDNDGVYDRLLTTVLQKMDLHSEAYRDRVIVILSTSNVPDAIDAAFIRRAGGRIETFKRPSTRGAFSAVLSTQLRQRPLAAGGTDPLALVVQTAAGRYFAPNARQPLLEVRPAGGGEPHRLHASDFFSGALIAQAVDQAARAACDGEMAGTGAPGLTPELLVAALDRQVSDLLAQISERNVADFSDLPAGMRVASVRHLNDQTHRGA